MRAIPGLMMIGAREARILAAIRNYPDVARSGLPVRASKRAAGTTDSDNVGLMLWSPLRDLRSTSAATRSDLPRVGSL